ncbi:MAG: addiction module protein [Acidobacteriaceae bacterium]
MPRTQEEILNDALQLPPEIRAALADSLLASLDSDDATQGTPEEIEQAWLAEAERRCEQIDRGEVEMVPWEEVRAKLEARLRH